MPEKGVNSFLEARTKDVKSEPKMEQNPCSPLMKESLENTFSSFPSTSTVVKNGLSVVTPQLKQVINFGAASFEKNILSNIFVVVTLAH